MLSLEKLRKIDPKLEKYSDEELTKIRALLYSLGDLAIESYLDKVKNKKDEIHNILPKIN